MIMEALEIKHEIYFIDFGTAKVYYQILEDGSVISRDRRTTISRQKFLDYLATAKELGHKTGKI